MRSRKVVSSRWAYLTAYWTASSAFPLAAPQSMGRTESMPWPNTQELQRVAAGAPHPMRERAARAATSFAVFILLIYCNLRAVRLAHLSLNRRFVNIRPLKVPAGSLVAALATPRLATG